MQTLVELCAEYVRTNPSVTSPYTVKLLQGTVKLYSDFLKRQAYIADLTDANVRAYAAHRQRQGRAAATVEREGTKLLTLWRFASMHGLVKPPTVRLAKASPQIPVAFLKHEIRALIKSAHSATGNIGGVPCKIFFPAILGLVWETGERVGAVRKLTRSDIDIRSRWVTYKHRKGHGAPMMKRMSRHLARSMKQLLAASEHEHPFAHVHLTTTYFHLKVILRRANLPADRRSMLHRLRRSHASYLRLAGGDSTASLGHSSDTVTNRHYHDPRIVGQKQAPSLLPSIFGWWQRILSWVGFW